MYKRLFYATLAAFVLTLTFSVFAVMDAYADRPITVYVDGKKIDFPDAKPQFVDGRIMVPIRFVSEALGSTVTRDAKTNSVYITSAPAQPCEPVVEKPVQEKPEQKQAAVAEIIEFSNSKAKVNGISYSTKHREFVAPEGRHFAIVNMDVYTDATPTTSVEWSPLDFVHAFVLSDGREIIGSISTTDKMEKGEWNNVDVVLMMPKDERVAGIILNDVKNKDEKARVNF